MVSAGPATLAMRGTIEGFYGPPWSHEQRLAHLTFSARVGLDTYVYAPKDDAFHRARWRDLYPPTELESLAEVARVARRLGVHFVYALHPALSMRFSDDAEHATLAAKVGQLADAGVTSFALLFDDVPEQLADDADVARFGAGPEGLGAAHGFTCTRFTETVLGPRGLPDALLACPTDYAGTADSPYRQGFARTAPQDVVVTWTGSDVVVGRVSRADIDSAAASYRRRVVLWDNFPVNDFEPSRLFLGPLTGRTTDLEGAPLAGMLANAMVQAAPSRFSLATVADWAHDPAGYEPNASAAAALTTVAGAGAADLAPLVRVCSSWPPSADQDPELTRAVEGALAGKPEALDVLSERLSELAAGCAQARQPADLVAALRPWLDGALATAEAGLAAVRLQRAADAGDADVAGLRRRTRAALDRAEEHYANVLRPVVPPFVRAVLDRTAPPVPDRDDRPAALLVTGVEPSAGDRATAEFLDDHGFAVRPTSTPGEEIGAAVAVVTRTAAPAALAALATAQIPIIAWSGMVELGLTTSERVVLSRDQVRIVDAGDPLAAGLHGVVSVYRGPGRITVADVAARPHQVASDGTGAAIFRYAAGDPLADGTPAPAARIGLFLGPDGPARWLLTETGRALVAAALDAAVST